MKGEKLTVKMTTRKLSRYVIYPSLLRGYLSARVASVMMYDSSCWAAPKSVLGIYWKFFTDIIFALF